MNNINLFGGGEFDTNEGGCLFLLSIIGIWYYIFKYHPTWEFGIILIFCFFLGMICDLAGAALHDLRIYIWNKIKNYKNH